MDRRIEEAMVLLRRYRSQFTAEPLCSLPQHREYVERINEVVVALDGAGHELSQFRLKQEIAPKGKNRREDEAVQNEVFAELMEKRDRKIRKAVLEEASMAVEHHAGDARTWPDMKYVKRYAAAIRALEDKP